MESPHEPRDDASTGKLGEMKVSDIASRNEKPRTQGGDAPTRRGSSPEGRGSSRAPQATPSHPKEEHPDAKFGKKVSKEESVDISQVSSGLEISPFSKKIQKREETWLKPLRTYKSDIAAALKKEGGGSLTKFAIAEQEKRGREEKKEKEERKGPSQGEEQPARAGKKSPASFSLGFNTAKVKDLFAPLARKSVLIGAGSIVLIVVGVGAAYFAFSYLGTLKGRSAPIDFSQAIIITDRDKDIALSDLTEEELRRAALQEIRGADLPINTVEAIYFTKEFPKKPDSVAPAVGVIGIRELFIIVRNEMPAALLRALDDERFLFGIHALQENVPFLIAKTDSFESAFASMLAWERSMYDDLAPLFALGADETDFTTKSFKDEVFKNRDIRVLRDKGGNAVLLYSFPDRETVVITTGEQTLDELVIRLKTPKRIVR